LRKKDRYLFGDFYEEFEGYVKTPRKRAAIHIGAPAVNIDGICIFGTFLERN
jgi:hypothetical protein